MVTYFGGGRWHYEDYPYPYYWGRGYSNDADYNTNAKSYYDYLAQSNDFLGWVSNAVNYLLNRKFVACSSKTVKLTKSTYVEGDCGNCNDDCRPCKDEHEVNKLEADVKISKVHNRIHLPALQSDDIDVGNGLKVECDGLWVADYEDIINRLAKKVGSYEDKIKDLEKTVDNLEEAMQRIVENLDKSGSITTDNYKTFKFHNNHHIATGTINLFSDKVDGDYFIKTSTKKKQNDVAIGYTK